MIKIKTLVELFDESQIENVIAVLRYKPEKVIFVGFKKVMTNRRKAAIEQFFKLRRMDIAIDYEIVGRYDYACVVDKLKSIIDGNEDCCIDITGGKELILTAVGAVSAAKKVPVVQFDIRNGRYTPVLGCEGLSETDNPSLTVEEIIVLNGGAVIHDEANDFEWDLDDDFLYDIGEMWDICRRNCGLWNRQSAVLKNFEQYGHIDGLNVRASLTHMKNIGQDAYINTGIISDLSALHIIENFSVSDDNVVTFTYWDEQRRQCLTKAGNILELYIYMLLREIEAEGTGCYDDIDIGVYVDWDGEIHSGDEQAYETKNEIDIIVMRDAVPVFISCKNGEVKKEALYELDAVARHFGGAYVKMVLVCTYISSDAGSRKYLLQRARDMNIDVIDNVDLMTGEQLLDTLKKRIK